jgi:endoglucanase
VLAAVAIAALLAGASPSPEPGEVGSLLDPLKRALKGLAAAPAIRRRTAERSGEEPFRRLAASQLGYGPSTQKRFTSPRPFTSFRVVSEPDGATAFAGGAPLRAVRTEILGPIGTVWIGDFSPLSAPGRYRVVADNGLESFPFEVGPHVFDAAVRAVQRWFYYQRAFTAVEARYAEGPWTHPSDADKAPPGVVKGWHDAGDFSIYNASASAALFWMLEAYNDFHPADDATRIPESGNGIPDLLDEARWGLEWMLSVQAPSGGFANTTCQERYGPYGTNTPDRVPPYRSGEVGTVPTARAVGTLAYAASVFRPWDAAFAERCLGAARRGWAWLAAREGESSDGPTCPAVRRDGDPEVNRHVRMYAAAGLLLATGERRFRDEFERWYEEPRTDPDYHHVNGFAARIYLRAPAGDPARKRALRERLRALADVARADGAKHPFEAAARYQWGSISAGFHRTGTSSARLCLDEARGAADCEQALANVHYALGRNYLQLCYVTGLPGVSRGVKHVFHHWLATLRPTPYAFPGMVVGGPNADPDPQDVSYPHLKPVPVWGYWGDPAFPRDASTPLDGRYTENDSWSTNEVTVDWQAATLYGLYLARRLAAGPALR